MKVKTIASGSKGNCTIVLCDNTNIIIDMGISYLTLKRSLEENSLSFEQFNGILITHSHKDHINGLKSLVNHTNLTVYIPEKMYDDLQDIVPRYRCEFIEDNFNIQDVEIELIHTSHDAPCSVGYIIKYNDKSLVYVTDTGYINRKYLAKMTEKDIYIMEANHDEVMLMDGPYPRFLKERVIEALTKLRLDDNERVFQALKSSLDDESAQVRINAIEALMESSHPKASEAIRICLDDKDEEVRKNALIALYNIQGRDILDEVISLPTYVESLKQEAKYMIEEYEND